MQIPNFLTGAFGRLIRAGLSMALAAAVAHYQNNEWYLSLSPFLQTVSKKLRDKWPGTFEWLPI